MYHEGHAAKSSGEVEMETYTACSWRGGARSVGDSEAAEGAEGDEAQGGGEAMRPSDRAECVEAVLTGLRAWPVASGEPPHSPCELDLLAREQPAALGIGDWVPHCQCAECVRRGLRTT